jgi:hypothetical protein
MAGVLLGVAVVSVGCDKSGSTAGKPADETYSKKLVGVWEGTEEGAKGDKPETVTFEFKADTGLRVAAGPIELTGTWKVVKEEGKTLTVDTEMSFPPLGDPKAAPKPDKKTLSVTFEDANTIVVTPTDKHDPKKLKRKT